MQQGSASEDEEDPIIPSTRGSLVLRSLRSHLTENEHSRPSNSDDTITITLNDEPPDSSPSNSQASPQHGRYHRDSQGVHPNSLYPEDTKEEEEEEDLRYLPSRTSKRKSHKKQKNKDRTPSLPPPSSRTPVCPLWTRITEQGLHEWIRRAVTLVATQAARHPWTCVWGIALFSFAIAVIGVCTNFVIYFDHGSIFTPLNSPPARHGHWMYEESGFVESADMLLIVHANGDNVINSHAVRKAFEALETLQNVDGYDKACAESTYKHPFTNDHTCWVWSVTQFWEHNVTLFDEHNPSELELIQAFSQPVFPDGIPVFDEVLFGALERVNINETVFKDAMDELTNNQTIRDAINATAEWYAEYGFTLAEDVDIMKHIPAYMINIGFPDTDTTYEFQERALLELQDLRNKWALEDHHHGQQVHLDFFCSYAYALEYERALLRDMPLILVIFLVMLFFTMFIFHKYGQQQHSHANGETVPLWQSRASLGLASVITIGMSLMSGFGMLFCWGVPFTNITLMAPFIILGVGLDDTFIITGAYFRRLRESHKAQRLQGPKEKVWNDKVDSGEEDRVHRMDRGQHQEEIEQRIRATMREVGLSVSLTTLTTTFAFLLGCISTIPGIRWLCIYASVTIVFDFLYQISFFIALLVLDARRVAGILLRDDDGRYPGWLECMINYCCCCCCWCCCCCGFQVEPPGSRARRSSATNLIVGSSMDLEALEESNSVQEDEEFFMDRIMRWYAKQLLKPVVKVLVILVFLACMGLNIYSTTKLEQRFNIEDYVPADSYTRPFFRSMEEYSSFVVPMAVYFRDVDQSDHEIQEQMIEYVEDMSSLEQIEKPPDFCWVRDLHMLFEVGTDLKEQLSKSETFKNFGEHRTEKLVFLLEALNEGNFTFEEKLNVAMNVPGLRDIYGEDIIRDEEGKITASRCFIFIRKLDLTNIHQQIEMLHDTREVTMRQPINQDAEDKNRLPFFAYDDLFAYWQLYTVAVEELMLTTIVGVVAVCLVGFIIIPNWTAVLFVGPLIVMLYFNLLGTLQACGIYINAVTYVTVVISIGLLVDFLMHILLRYYETTCTTREAKVRETLETMGASMLLGGFTTWLGVIPLAFSTTKIFYTLFIAFLAMVSWGVLVGLVLLPVLLSIWGPEVTTSAPSAQRRDTSKPGRRSRSLHSIAESETGADVTSFDDTTTREYQPSTFAESRAWLDAVPVGDQATRRDSHGRSLLAGQLQGNESVVTNIPRASTMPIQNTGSGANSFPRTTTIR